MASLADHCGFEMRVQAPFRQAIPHVVSMCAKEQMLGIHATWVIAMMEDPKTIRDWAATNHP